jgi:hypothetical protein
MMSKIRLISLTILFILGTALSIADPSRSAAPSWTSGDKLVITYFFYWYDIYTNRHFIDPDGTDANTHHPPDGYMSNYSYKEIAWHRRELLDIMDAKIDVVLPVYWGDNVEIIWSKPGLQNLVTATQELIGEGYTPPKIGMFYDTSALKNQNGGIPPDLTTTDGKALFYNMAADFFELVPQDLWAMIDGRPIVSLYTAEFVSAYDQSTFDSFTNQFRTDFGVKPYIVREASWSGVNTEGAYQWGVALNGPVNFGHVGSLGPGYDETAVYQRPNPRVRDRECGDFYNQSWEAIANSGATLVALETWNEFHEGTDIAASREYSRTYITLTAHNVQNWKETDYSKSDVIWLDFGSRLYLRGLGPAFNQPDGAWLVTTLKGREAAYMDNTTTPISYYIYLAVNDDFINATTTEVWVTVEYFDQGTDQWRLEYDSATDPHQATQTVTLGDTGEWQRQTFHLTDAYFGGRQNLGADLRLFDYSNVDGKTNYFGRIWISKSAPTNQAPDLEGLGDLVIPLDHALEKTVIASDPDGDPLSLALEIEFPLVSFDDHGDGTGTLQLSPTASDLQPCPYYLRLIATDNGSPTLSDVITVRVSIYEHQIYLPTILYAK